MLHIAMLELLTPVIQSALQTDPQAQERLDALGTQTVSMELLPLPRFGVYIEDGQLKFGSAPEVPSLMITGHLAAFARYVMTGRLEEVQLQGDVDIAQDLRNFFYALDLDLEETLSQVVGDTPAHITGRAVTGAVDVAQSVGSAVYLNVQDYLQEESDLMPHVEEVEAFIREVDNLRDDIERLEVRLERLID